MDLVLVPAGNLKARMLLDMAGDAFADPNGTDEMMAEGYAMVSGVKVSDDGVQIEVFFIDFEPVIFPINHKLSALKTSVPRELQKEEAA